MEPQISLVLGLMFLIRLQVLLDEDDDSYVLSWEISNFLRLQKWLEWNINYIYCSWVKWRGDNYEKSHILILTCLCVDVFPLFFLASVVY